MRRSRRFAKRATPIPTTGTARSLRLMLLGAEQLSACRRPMCARCSINTRRNSRAALVDDLGYRGPALLFKAVLAARAAVRKPAFFKRAIDLGCGTGLAATAFAKEVDHFIGIDLSPRMIEKARATGLYAELEVADMLEGLRGRPEASAELILAADAMVYVADLAPVLTEAQARAGRRRPAGVHRGNAWRRRRHPRRGAALRPRRGLRARVASKRPVLKLSQLEELSARNEDNTPVPGLVVVAAKS